MIKKRKSNNINILIDLIKKHNLDGYLLTLRDNYLNSFPGSKQNKLRRVSGFTGSNGIMLVKRNSVHFLTDGRYLLQASNELPEFVIIYDISKFSLNDFLLPNEKIGFSSINFSFEEISQIEAETIFFDPDLSDLILEEEEAVNKKNPYLYDIKYSGQEKEQKIEILLSHLKDDAIFLNDPVLINWLLNIRGYDDDFSPIMLCNCLITKDKKIYVYAEEESNLGDIELFNIKQLNQHLKGIKSLEVSKNIQYKFVDLFKSLKIKLTFKQNNIYLTKSIKNETEIMHAKNCHVKDAIALCNVFAWVKMNAGSITELDVEEKIKQEKSKQEDYVSESFPSIIGFQENAAIIHYNPVNNPNSSLVGDNGMLLMDMGSQYKGATTDVTRTISIGQVSADCKQFYTRVLVGHLKLANYVFDQETKGKELDYIARSELLKNNMDYAHSTGHGVGSFLSVHEFPPSISKLSNVRLYAGQVVSNEPGYYVNGQFGIRIENLMLVIDGGGNKLAFENLTLLPYDKNLLDMSLLGSVEIKWLSEYYEKIRNLILPNLQGNVKNWLENELDIF